MIGPGFDGLDPNDPFHSYHRDPPWSEEGQVWGVITTMEEEKDWQRDYGIIKISSAEAQMVEARVTSVAVKPGSTVNPSILKLELIIQVTKKIE